MLRAKKEKYGFKRIEKLFRKLITTKTKQPKKLLSTLNRIEKLFKLKKKTIKKQIIIKEKKGLKLIEKEKEVETNEDIIIHFLTNTQGWIEYETELRKAKPFDCFKKRYNYDNDYLKTQSPKWIRDKIFNYFDMGNPYAKQEVKYYTVYTAIKELGMDKYVK